MLTQLMTEAYVCVIFAISVEVGPLDVGQETTTRAAHTRKKQCFVPKALHHAQHM